MFSHKLSTTTRLFPLPYRNIHTTRQCFEIQKLTKLRVVDNSEIGKRAMAEGKPPKCIHVYNRKGIGMIGNTTLINLNIRMSTEISF